MVLGSAQRLTDDDIFLRRLNIGHLESAPLTRQKSITTISKNYSNYQQ